jgi:hypothetical protein
MSKPSNNIKPIQDKVDDVGRLVMFDYETLINRLLGLSSILLENPPQTEKEKAKFREFIQDAAELSTELRRELIRKLVNIWK